MRAARGPRNPRHLPLPSGGVRLHATTRMGATGPLGFPIVTPGPGFENLDGVVTSPEFFTVKLSKLVGRITGQYKTTGAGAVLEFVEDDGVDEVVAGTLVLPDSSGAWTNLPAFNTNVPPRSGQNVYLLRGKLDTATAAALRFVAMSILEVTG